MDAADKWSRCCGGDADEKKVSISSSNPCGLGCVGSATRSVKGDGSLDYQEARIMV